MIPSYVKPFHYHIPWKSSSVHYGDHRGTQVGLGDEFRGNNSLLNYPDARRLDLRQTIRDPFEQIQVKTFNQSNTTPVSVICDLSSSMQFGKPNRKLDTAIQIASSVAYSSYVAGDVFGFIAYNDQVLEDYVTPLSHHVFQNMETISLLKNYSSMGKGPLGIKDAPLYLSQSKSMVFWISDFHLPLGLIEQALNAMSVHQVIPVCIRDYKEYQDIPSYGFGNLVDPETGTNKSFFFRPALKTKFIDAFNARKELLQNIFLKFNFPPLFIDEGYKPELFSNYFEQNLSL